MYWHYYAYTLSELWPTVHGILKVLLPSQATMPDWWARRKAAFGLSTSAPLPYEPYVSGTLSMSLSGYYFKPAQRVRLVTTTMTSSNRVDASSTDTTTTAAVKKTPLMAPKEVEVEEYNVNGDVGDHSIDESEDDDDDSDILLSEAATSTTTTANNDGNMEEKTATRIAKSIPSTS
jgi:hypothetical protein